MLKALFIVFIFSVSVTYAQGPVQVSGKITDESGKPVSFASVFIKDTNISTMANETGNYRILLKPGNYILTCRYVGFKSIEKEVNVQSSLVLNLTLEEDIYKLKEVNVTAGKNDAANSIVRSVISRRKFLRAVPSYQCDVYTKGIQKLLDAPKRILGTNVARTLNLDSNRQGILYQSETKSKFFFRYPQKKEVMEASKVAGDNQGFSFNRALDLQVNFYDNTLNWPALGNQSFVSPVAYNAFNYYRFKLIGSSQENGKTIQKIKVIPKSRFSPVFSGYIYVLEDDPRLYSVDLMLTEHARINFVDTLHISQHFSEIGDMHWLPSDITIRFNGKVLGFNFAGYYTALYSNYKTDPVLPDDFFDEEILKIDTSANKYNDTWWANNRPVPLTREEEDNYEQHDAMGDAQKTRAYQDSVQKELNKFRPLRYIVAGQRIENVSENSFWYVYPLHSTIFYNTVEGWGLRLRARYVKRFSPYRSLEAEPNIRYGFSSEVMNANAEITYRTDSLRHTSFTVRGGSDFLDLNNRGTINLFYNTLTTLFEGKNYLKLYQAKFLSLSGQREVADGLMFTAGAEIARRFPLQNSSSNPVFRKTAETITSNNPLSPGFETEVFPVNNSLSIEAKISYTFGQQYTSRPDGKIFEPARYPTIMIDYRKGIPRILKSAVDYDFISADLFQDKIRTALWGYSSFYLSAGKFLNTSSLYFPDWHHFTGNQTAVYNPLFPNFHFLDYYAFATNDRFFEAHYEHNFSGRFIRKVPLLRKLKLEEIIGGAYLTQPQNNYKEAYIGFQRLMFRIDYGFSWTPGREMYRAFRLFYGF
ncbi:DUF5686 and carboxypeptidase regulatory-like domain-containing protein [Arcticibacter tournemirensis]|uniref:Carboxypeptidase-like regulatory domain-containing protein n=1 Tax=Arcticibacter tournemirensis TaxID=699437 RepID=A0A4Q0MBN5_9SPHI|nr:DUF5686 and carboxypeptidase regulatory-like domain-containing protein [Arcticibacter tournemirensis]RXF70717.1 carboxypeptidase-like regulatory domain-containing protein [Arcticibacter tournemirensis]